MIATKQLTNALVHGNIVKYRMEWYRSGHNGADSKSVRPQGLVGSNPTRSAKSKSTQISHLTDLSACFLLCSKFHRPSNLPVQQVAYR